MKQRSRSGSAGSPNLALMAVQFPDPGETWEEERRKAQGHLSSLLICALFSGACAKGQVERESAANGAVLSILLPPYFAGCGI